MRACTVRRLLERMCVCVYVCRTVCGLVGRMSVGSQCVCVCVSEANGPRLWSIGDVWDFRARCLGADFRGTRSPPPPPPSSTQRTNAHALAHAPKTTIYMAPSARARGLFVFTRSRARAHLLHRTAGSHSPAKRDRASPLLFGKRVRACGRYCLL